MEGNDNQNFFTFSEFSKALTNFQQHYDLCNLVITPDTPQPKGKPKAERICRFCDTKNDPRAFKSDSHLIPEMLGNKYLFADFECDNCNQLLSKYENDLAYSLGILRTLFGIKGKRGIPTFDSKSKTIRAKEVDFYGLKAVAIEETAEQIKSFQVDKDTGKCNITYKKHGYVPINLYKILYKIALSIIPEDDVPQYKRAYEFILSEQKLELVAGSCKVLIFDLPFEFQIIRPVCYLFKKRDKNSRLPTHYFVFHFLHMVYEFPLRYHAGDIQSGLYQTSEIELPFCPPILYHAPGSSSCVSQIRDMSSYEKVEEEQHIGFDIDPEYLTKLGAMNPETGELTGIVFKPEEIVKMVFYKGDETPNFPKPPKDSDKGI